MALLLLALICASSAITVLGQASERDDLTTGQVEQLARGKPESLPFTSYPFMIIHGFKLDETSDLPEIEVLATLYNQWEHGDWWGKGKPDNQVPKFQNQELIWTPQVTVINAAEDRLMEESVEPLENGRVMVTKHGGFTAVCGDSESNSDSKNYRMFPFDDMYCHLDISSRTQSKNNMRLSWKGVSPVYGMGKGVQLQGSAKNGLKEWDMKVYTNDSDDGRCERKEQRTSYDCLKVKLSFSRKWGPYIYYYMVPCAVLVCLSWLAFWLKRGKGITARVILALFTGSLVYYLSWCFTSERPGNRVTVLEIYAGVCLLLIILSLIETVVVHAMRKKKWKKTSDSRDTEEYPVYEEKPLVSFIVTKHEKAARRIDRAAAVLFPLIFLIFNAVFWPCILLLS